MPRFMWADIYNIGDVELDGQHRQLFALANEVLDASAKKSLVQAVMRLYRHTRDHFEYEQNLIKEFQARLPDTPPWKKK